MWKWTDASQQIGVLQHKKKFKYTRKVGDRYYYDDQKATVSMPKEIPDLVSEYFKAIYPTLTNELADPNNIHYSVDKSKDGTYGVTMTDKTTGKVVMKTPDAERVSMDYFTSENKYLSGVHPGNSGNTESQNNNAANFQDNLRNLSNKKISNIMKNKALTNKKNQLRVDNRM